MEDVFDDDRFDVGQPAALDGSGNRGWACAPGLLPRGKAFFQAGKRALAVHVGSGLRKDGGNQFVQRIKVSVRRGHAVRGFEILSDVAKLGFDWATTPVFIAQPSAT